MKRSPALLLIFATAIASFCRAFCFNLKESPVSSIQVDLRETLNQCHHRPSLLHPQQLEPMLELGLHFELVVAASQSC